MKAINPATGKLVKEYKEHTDAEVKKIIEAAHDAFLSWRDVSFAERSRLARKAAEVLRGDMDKYAKLITVEMGKVIRESRAEVEKCAWVCEYYADNGGEFLADEMVETDAGKS